MDDRNSYLEGEDEYLEVQDDHSDCGTQLDGDEILQCHDTYNFTQVDENIYHPDPLLAENKEDSLDCCSDHDGRADDEDIDFPDLAVTQTQQSHTSNVNQTSIQRNDVYGLLDREASADERDRKRSSSREADDDIPTGLEIEVKVNEISEDNFYDKKIEGVEAVNRVIEEEVLEEKTAAVEMKRTDEEDEQEEDDDGEDLIDICVDDTQPAAVVLFVEADVPTDFLEDVDVTSMDEPKIVPTTCITLDPCEIFQPTGAAADSPHSVPSAVIHSGQHHPNRSPGSPMSTPNFPYTFGSPEIAASDILNQTAASIDDRLKVTMMTDTQSCTTHFTASEAVGAGGASPRLLSSNSIARKERFYMASPPRALPSPAMATKGSDTCHTLAETQVPSTKTAEESRSKDPTVHDGCRSSIAPGEVEVASGVSSLEKILDEHKARREVDESWVESRRVNGSLRGNILKVDSCGDREASGLDNVPASTVPPQMPEDMALMDLETRRSILKQSYARREAELKDLYLSEVRELDRIESLGIDVRASREKQSRDHLQTAEMAEHSHAPTLSRMFHTVLLSPVRSEACPALGVEEDVTSLSRKPKRRFNISPRDRPPQSGIDLDGAAGQVQDIQNMKGPLKLKKHVLKKDVYSFEDSQSDIFLYEESKVADNPESAISLAASSDVLVPRVERMDHIVDTDEDEVVNSCVVNNNRSPSADKCNALEDVASVHAHSCLPILEPHLAKKRLQKGKKKYPSDLSPPQHTDIPGMGSIIAAGDAVQMEKSFESTEEHHMLDVIEDTRTSDADWVSRVMTIPWKVLYIEHLSKEGWTWNYISGLEPICYYVPGFGPLDDNRRKDMTDQQVMEYEQRVPVLNVSKFTSEDNIRRFIRRTRHADYEPSDLSQREEAERVADFGSEWNLARNRKRRKSNPSFHYNPEDYFKNTCDMSQGANDFRDQTAEGGGRNKKKKGDDDVLKLEKTRRKNEALHDQSPEYNELDKYRHKDGERSSNMLPSRGETTDMINMSVKPQHPSAYDDEDHRPVVDVIRDRRAKIELLKASSAALSDRSTTSLTNESHSTSGLENNHKAMTSIPRRSRDGLMKYRNSQRGETTTGGMGSRQESAYKEIHRVMQGGDSEQEDQGCDWSPDSHEGRRGQRPQGSHEAETQPQDFPSLVDTPEERRISMKENYRSTGNIRNRGHSVASSSASSSPPKPHNTFTNNISAEMQGRRESAFSSSSSSSFSCISQAYARSTTKSTVASAKGKGSGPMHSTSTLFRGMTFILSGNNDDDKDAVTARIKRNGGTVISQLPFLAAMEDHLNKAQEALEQGSSPPFFDHNLKVGLLSQHIILLSRPTNFRKSNFLLVLATGGTLLHHLWATRSMDKGTLLSQQEYSLPSGASALWPFYVFNSAQPPPVFGVLACLRVLNFAGKQWSPLLAVCGVQVTPHNEMLLRAFGPGKVIDRRLYNVDIVVVDCLSYSEVVTRRHVEKFRGVRKKSKEAGGLTTLELAAIEGCMEREGQLSVCEGGIKVVTIDWVVHCLQLGDQVPFDSNDIFALPLDPVNRPLGHKNDATKGNGERFMKYDVCYYRRANEDKEQLGQIRGFSRKSPSAPMQVRVRPLHLSGGYKDMQTPGTSRESGSPSMSVKNPALSRMRNEIHAKDGDRRGTGEGTSFNLKDRELTPAADQEEVLMDATVLTGKAAVLSQQSSRELAYALSDRDVFVSSAEWERSHRLEMNEGMESDEDDSARMQAQMSQDY